MGIWLIAMCPAVLAISSDGYLADPSKSALAYLRLPASARAAALGGAVNALEGDVAYALVNPALSARATKITFTASAGVLSLDRRQHFAGVLYPLTDYLSTIGVGWNQAGVADIERRNENGITDGSFSDAEQTLAIWYAGGITQKLLVGAAGQYHTQILDDATARGLSGDVGLFWNLTDKLNVAFVGRNLGWMFRWDTGAEERIAPSIGTGAAFLPFKDHLAISSDLEWTPGNYVQGHGGIQATGPAWFSLRAGVQAPNPIQGSCGVGILYKALTFDYAFTFHQSGLGHSHLLSISAGVK